MAPGLGRLPQVLSPYFVLKRSTAQESIAEILVADIGQGSESELHLIVSHLLYRIHDLSLITVDSNWRE